MGAKPSQVSSPTAKFTHGTGTGDYTARYQMITGAGLNNDVSIFYAADSANFGWSIQQDCGTAGTDCTSPSHRGHPAVQPAGQVPGPMAEREASCLQLARAVGLTTVTAHVEVLADIPCLIVSRFDRVTDDDGSMVRVHQEDACQALARDPRANRGRGRYHSGGGPGFSDIAGLLDRWARDPLDELVRLLRVATYTVVIGNADAHGKNLAVLHPDPETIELAPLYATVPTVLWPKLRRDPAMPFGAQVRSIDRVTAEDLVSEAALWRLDRDLASESIASCARGLGDAVGPTTPPDLAEIVITNVDRLLSG